MREAFSLLNKSIIRVEQPDINLEETEEQLEAHPDVEDVTPMDVDQASTLCYSFSMNLVLITLNIGFRLLESEAFLPSSYIWISEVFDIFFF